MNKLALVLIAAGIIINSLSIYLVTKRNTAQDNALFSILNIMGWMNEDYEKLKERVEHLEEREIDE